MSVCASVHSQGLVTMALYSQLHVPVFSIQSPLPELPVITCYCVYVHICT